MIQLLSWSATLLNEQQILIMYAQGHSQSYIKGGSKFSRPWLSRDKDSLSGKTVGHQSKRAPSGI